MKVQERSRNNSLASLGQEIASFVNGFNRLGRKWLAKAAALLGGLSEFIQLLRPLVPSTQGFSGW